MKSVQISLKFYKNIMKIQMLVFLKTSLIPMLRKNIT